MIRAMWRALNPKDRSFAIALAAFAFVSICSVDDSFGRVGGWLDAAYFTYLTAIAVLFAFARRYPGHGQVKRP
jgi:hypothetical protein